ncbi:N-acetylmuramic acid 6-phosphate etherase [Clostridia bacterium]|nr:N-acetylmuramic acid 6-phosphate etherase [Clostridia bacterium]
MCNQCETHTDTDELIASLLTEQRNPRSVGIAKLPVLEMLQVINEEDQTVALRVREALPQIVQAVTLIEERLRQGGRLIYVGAGTSGRLGCMDAAECGPTYGVSNVLSVMAGGREAMFAAQEGVEDDKMAAAQDLAARDLTAQDVVCAVAASGRTPYCIGALQYAETVAAGRISISCNPDAVLSRYAQAAIEVATGPEVIMGSTRMKAATAQKMIVNMLSTAAMVRLGRTYDNLMVNIRAHNEKADNRMLRLFAEALGDGDIANAKARLEVAHGDLAAAVRDALAETP